MQPRKIKSKILRKANKAFLKGVKKVERSAWRTVLNIIGGLNRSNGTINNDAFNVSQLLSLDSRLIPIFTDGLAAELPSYLANFDDIERLNRLIYTGFLPDGFAARISRLVFPVERVIMVDSITGSLTTPALIKSQMVDPIRSILYNGITFSQPVNTLKELLRSEILSGDSTSKLARYSGQIAQDAISRFDGAINDRIRDDLGLDGFYYIGSKIKTSRQNCNELVDGSGRFAELAISPGVYRVQDIDKIIALAKGRPGWNKSTTKETFAQFRGGYNCRHEIVYFMLSEKQQLIAIKKLN